MCLLFLLILCTQYIQSAGFAGNTLLLTNQSHITFDQLTQNMFIQASKKDIQPMLFLQKQCVEKVICISIADEIITCHPKQLFWCVNKSSWEYAQDLITGDLLQTVDEQHIAIDTVQKIQQQTKIYSLTVGPPHHLYVGKNSVLAHNMVPVFVGVVAPLVTSASIVKCASAVLCTGLVALGGFIANCFAKNNNKKKPKCTVAAQPAGSCSAFFNPNDNDKNKHPHGIYEDADYHGQYQNGRKSPRPKDGQRALDNSVAVQYSPGQRVAIEDGKIVTLQETQIGKYHGYVNTWEEILLRGGATSNMRATLIKNGLVSKTGKILQ